MQLNLQLEHPIENGVVKTIFFSFGGSCKNAEGLLSIVQPFKLSSNFFVHCGSLQKTQNVPQTLIAMNIFTINYNQNSWGKAKT